MALLEVAAIDEGRQYRRQDGGDDHRGGHLEGGDGRDPGEGMVGQRHRLGGGDGVAGGAACCRPGNARAAKQTISPIAHQPGDHQDRDAQDNPGDAGGGDRLQVDALAEGEGHEGHDDGFMSAAELADIRVQVAQHGPGGDGGDHRHHGQPRDDRQPGAHQHQHGQERPGLDALHHVGAGVLFAAEGAGQGQEHAAVGVVHGGEHGQGGQADEVAVEQVGDAQGDQDGDPHLGDEDAEAALQHLRRGPQGHLAAGGEQVHGQHRRVADVGQGLGEAADLQEIGGEGVDQHPQEQRDHHQSARQVGDSFQDFHDLPLIG